MEFDARVQEIGDDDWDRPTPCSEWSVRDLVNHIVNEDKWIVPLLEGKTIAEVGDEFDGDLLGDDPKAAWAEARDAALAASSGDEVLDRTVNVSWGQISGKEYLSQIFSDHLIHAWDLARGIGASEEMDEELVEVCYEMSKPQEEFMKSTGFFGGVVEPAEDADTWTKLLAVYGRTA